MGPAELTLAALLALATHLHDGAQALEKKDYAGAVTQLTAAIEIPAAPPAAVAAARLLRAEALTGAGRKDAAWDDLRHVATHDVPAPMRQQARAAWKKAGGDPAKLMPSATPRETIDALRAAVEREDHAAVREKIGGRLLTMIEAMTSIEGGTHQAEMMAGMMSQMAEMRIVEETVDGDAGLAMLGVRNDSERGMLTMRQDGNRWILSDYKMVATIMDESGAEIPVAALAPGPQEVADVNDPFSDKARPPGAKPAAGPKAEEVPQALREEAGRLIARLGDVDPAARSAARRRLKEMGAAIRPLLESRRADPDPEIASTVKELLAE